MKIRKRPVDNKLVKKLKRENEILSMEEMATGYGISRSVMIEVINLNIATPTTEQKLNSKSLIPA